MDKNTTENIRKSLIAEGLLWLSLPSFIIFITLLSLPEGMARVKTILYVLLGVVVVYSNVRIIAKAKRLLVAHNKELDEIISETESEEAVLLEKSEKEAKKVDERLLRAYRRIRSGAKNGLAVVPVERGASGGSFISIPPQRQIEIASRKKIIYDEHSGRILIDAEMAEELNVSVNKMMTKLLSK